MTYSHTAILPVIAAPNCAEVISLPPEFVTPQDGHEKQDCETAAAKRWISKHRHLFQGQAITLLGDDLYSRQPMCRHCLDAEMNFIGNVSDLLERSMGLKQKLISVDKQTNDNIMHHNGFRKANRLSS